MPQIAKYPSNADRQRAYRERTAQARAAQLSERSLPALPAIPTMDGEVRWRVAMTHALSNLKTVHIEMKDYYDHRSQQWQQSEREEEFLERIEALDTLIEDMENSLA